MRRPRPRGYQNSHILLFDQAAILSSRPALSRAGARSGRQGWPQATAQRLVLDGREHDGTNPADGRDLPPPRPRRARPPAPAAPPPLAGGADVAVYRRIFAAANSTADRSNKGDRQNLEQ